MQELKPLRKKKKKHNRKHVNVRKREISMFLEISVVILSFVFLLIAVLSVPFLLQIWRTAKSMATTLQMLNESLPGILKNLEEITT